MIRRLRRQGIWKLIVWTLPLSPPPAKKVAAVTRLHGEVERASGGVLRYRYLVVREKELEREYRKGEIRWLVDRVEKAPSSRP